MIVNIDEDDGWQPSVEETSGTVHPPPKERGGYFFPEDVDTHASGGVSNKHRMETGSRTAVSRNPSDTHKVLIHQPIGNKLIKKEGEGFHMV